MRKYQKVRFVKRGLETLPKGHKKSTCPVKFGKDENWTSKSKTCYLTTKRPELNFGLTSGRHICPPENDLNKKETKEKGSKPQRGYTCA
jgi:hypothetical protein